MAGRSYRRRFDPSSPVVDLDDVFADDKLVDAIAAAPWRGAVHDGIESKGSLLTVDPLTELLGSWRQELLAAPLPAPPTAVVPMPDRAPRPARTLRPALAIAAAIAALLVGSASISSKDASPDSALWVITEVLWPNRAQSVESVAHVQAALREARFALTEGRPQDAQIALLRATVELGNVDDVDGRSDMQQSVVELWAQAGPQNLPANTQPPEFVNLDRPSGAVTRSSVSGATLPSTVAPMAATVQAAAAAAVEPAQPAASQSATTGAPQAGPDAGWPSVRSTPAAVVGSSTSSAADVSPTPTTSAVTDVSSESVTPPALPSVPLTPPPPTVSAAEPVAPLVQPAAPQQSAPSPTPSSSTPPSSTPPESTSPLADVPGQPRGQEQSSPLDSAAG